MNSLDADGDEREAVYTFTCLHTRICRFWRLWDPAASLLQASGLTVLSHRLEVSFSTFAIAIIICETLLYYLASLKLGICNPWSGSLGEGDSLLLLHWSSNNVLVAKLIGNDMEKK